MSTENENKDQGDLATRRGKTRIKRSTFTILLCIVLLFQAAQMSMITYMLVNQPRPPIEDVVIIDEPPPLIQVPSVSVKDYGAKGDGTTNDSTAVRNAFNEAQRVGRALYFPAGKYNLNNLALTVSGDVHMIGDGMERTTLINPGTFTCSKNITFRDMSVRKNDGIFIISDPVGFINLHISNVEYYTPNEFNDTSILVWSRNSNLNSGFESVELIDSKVSKARNALLLRSDINSGYIAGNEIFDLGNPANLTDNVIGIMLGDNLKNANNVLIENNRFYNINSATFSQDRGHNSEGHAVFLYGDKITVQNNHFENIGGGFHHEALYGKVTNFDILNNTFINAGDDEGAITVKAPDIGEEFYVNIIGNTIITNRPNIGAVITLTTNYFNVENNEITQTGASSVDAIRNYTREARGGVITNNRINTEGKSGIWSAAVDGDLRIDNNTINQKYSVKGEYAHGLIFVRAATPNSNIAINNNTLNVTDGVRAIALTGSNGSSAVIAGNSITVPEARIASVSLTGGIQGNISNNNFTQGTSTFFEQYPDRAGTAGIIELRESGSKHRITNNVFNYTGRSSTQLINIISNHADVIGNEFSYGRGSSITTAVIFKKATAVSDGSVKSELSRNKDISANNTYTLDHFITIDATINADNYIIYDNNSYSVNTRLIRISPTAAVLNSKSFILGQNDDIMSAKFPASRIIDPRYGIGLSKISAPVLTLRGSTSIEITQDNTYVEPGFTAVDGIDGDITDLVEVIGSPDTAFTGTYNITYSVTNSTGIVTEAMRTVIVHPAPEETPPPEETPAIEETPVPVETPTPAPEETPPPVDEPAEEPLPDPDVTIPVITLLGSAEIELNQGDTYVEPGFTAIDNIDGDISHLVVITGSVDTGFAGTYTLIYRAVDSSDNVAEVVRTIIVHPVAPPPVAPPIVTQIGSSPIVLHLGGTAYTEQGAIAYDEVDGDISASIVTTGNVDTTRAGTYKVTYSVTNSAGLSDSITRDVRVLAPNEQRSPRETFRFDGQGKVVSNFTYKVVAGSDGKMTITVAPASNTTVEVKVSDSTGKEVLNQRFSGTASKDVNVAQGDVTIKASIVVGNGNTKFTLTAVTPEVVTMTFTEPEIPLVPGITSPDTPPSNHLMVFIIIVEALNILGLGVVIVLLLKKRKTSVISETK